MSEHNIKYTSKLLVRDLFLAIFVSIIIHGMLRFGSFNQLTLIIALFVTIISLIIQKNYSLTKKGMMIQLLFSILIGLIFNSIPIFASIDEIYKVEIIFLLCAISQVISDGIEKKLNLYSDHRVDMYFVLLILIYGLIDIILK